MWNYENYLKDLIEKKDNNKKRAPSVPQVGRWQLRGFKFLWQQWDHKDGGKTLEVSNWFLMACYVWHLHAKILCNADAFQGHWWGKKRHRRHDSAFLKTALTFVFIIFSIWANKEAGMVLITLPARYRTACHYLEWETELVRTICCIH